MEVVMDQESSRSLNKIALVKKWLGSPLTMQCFCQEHQLSFSTFAGWVQLFRKGKLRNAPLHPGQRSGAHRIVSVPLLVGTSDQDDGQCLVNWHVYAVTRG